MTDPRLLDPVLNHQHYEACRGYEDNKGRLGEERVLWAASWLSGARRVLDVAANDGYMSTFLPEDAEYLGVDLNADAVANAYPRARGRLVRANVTTYAYPARSFDRVLCMEVLEHVVEPRRLLERLWDALEPGGLIVSTSAMGPGEAYEPGNREHLREWTPDEFRRLHESARFVVEELAVKRVYGTRFTSCVAARRPGGAQA